MSPLDILKTALWSLGSNKLRSGLTLLGIVIGVTAVIALMTIGRGVQQSITSRIQSQGANLLSVSPGATNIGNVSGGQGSASTLTLADAYALVDPIFAPSIEAVAPQISTNAQVVAGRENTNAQVIGITPEYGPVRNAVIETGQFITPGDVLANSQVAVLSATVAEDGTQFHGLRPLASRDVARFLIAGRRPPAFRFWRRSDDFSSDPMNKRFPASLAGLLQLIQSLFDHLLGFVHLSRSRQRMGHSREVE